MSRPLTRRQALAASALAVLFLVPPAFAAPADPAKPGDILSADAVRERLRRRGLVTTEPLVRRGPVYVALASDPRGEPLRVVVDGRSGDIIGLRALSVGSRADRR